MKLLKDKRFQIGALLLLLLLVAAAGIWWFNRPAREAGTEDDFTHVGDAVMEQAKGVAQSGRGFTHYRLAKAEQIELSFADTGSRQLFSYEDQTCFFHIEADEEGDGFSVSIVSADGGDVLCSWNADSFGDQFMPEFLYMDAGNTLWALYASYSGEENWQLYNVTEQRTVEVPAESVPEFCGDYDIVSFSVWDGHLILYNGEKLAVLDLDAGRREGLWTSVRSYCLDGGGNLYYLFSSSPRDTLVKYSLKDGGSLWSTNDLPSLATFAVTANGAGELFLLGSTRNARHEIFAMDPETGKTAWELTTLSRDLTEAADGLLNILTGAGFGFAIDADYGIYFSYLRFDLSAQEPEGRWVRRDLYIAQPVQNEVRPEDRVELTITAPMVIDSVDTAARLYQRDHPEVTFFWDTQYLSSEDFMSNYQEYKDQFALRAMGGGLGDVVMVNGFGLDTRIITNTDAFADLSGYLDACPFKDELQWNQIETMRGEDGAVRALPLGVVPTYCVWNAELLDQLGIDPDQVTWSELLDMALQWEQDGTALFLAASDDKRYGFEQILNQILLANLYAAKQPDGTVQLDQPYLRELMEDLKQLQGSNHLVQKVQQSIFYGSNKALFVAGDTNRNVADKVYDLMAIKNNGVMIPRAAAYPKGEVNKKQQGYAYCWGLNARSKKLDAAWDFLQFLISSESLSGGLYSLNTLPLNKQAQQAWAETYARDWSSTDGSGKTYFRQIQATLDIPCSAYEQPTGWYDAVYVPLLRYFDDEATLDEAMAEASANWERFVAE